MKNEISLNFDSYVAHDLKSRRIISLFIICFIKISQKAPNTLNLLQELFSSDSTRHDMVKSHFISLAHCSPINDFVILCNDLTVNLEPDRVPPSSTYPSPDPRRIWRDQFHPWWSRFDNFRPCDPARKPGTLTDSPDKCAAAYTIYQCWIYLCPIILDATLGRTLAPYKNLVLNDEWIGDYMITPAVLIHEFVAH